MTQVLQVTAVEIGGRALLIEGEPGSGKSSLALALIDRGARLIGDDGVMAQVQGKHLLISPHPETRGLIEVRNLGLLSMPVCEEARAALIVRLDTAAPRFIDAAESTDRRGLALPLVRLWPDSPVLALRAELALDRYGLVID
jgi:serine kinase of HPr protein (carbohydrate metabolism regulator)